MDLCLGTGDGRYFASATPWICSHRPDLDRRSLVGPVRSTSAVAISSEFCAVATRHRSCPAGVAPRRPAANGGLVAGNVGVPIQAGTDATNLDCRRRESAFTFGFEAFGSESGPRALSSLANG
jgi:hypothetical protein